MFRSPVVKVVKTLPALFGTTFEILVSLRQRRRCQYFFWHKERILLFNQPRWSSSLYCIPSGSQSKLIYPPVECRDMEHNVVIHLSEWKARIQSPVNWLLRFEKKLYICCDNSNVSRSSRYQAIEPAFFYANWNSGSAVGFILAARNSFSNLSLISRCSTMPFISRTASALEFLNEYIDTPICLSNKLFL